MRKSSRPVMRGPQENFTIAIIRCHRQFRLAEGFGFLNVIFEINFIFHSFFFFFFCKFQSFISKRFLDFYVHSFSLYQNQDTFMFQYAGILSYKHIGFRILHYFLITVCCSVIFIVKSCSIILNIPLFI